LKRPDPMMDRRTRQRYQGAAGLAGIQAVAFAPALMVAAMEDDAGSVRSAALALFVLGLVAFAGIYRSLRRLNRDKVANPGGKTLARVRGELRLLFVLAGSASILGMVLSGLVWIFPQRAHCLIRDHVLGNLSASDMGVCQ
jgi:hypothetical protein